jgi:hypothetical protein
MEQTKLEVSKPILSPTRSLDEGFESDPDRISTDSELTSSNQPTSAFDLHHRTSSTNSSNSSNGDNAQHKRYSSSNVESSPISSIICLDGEESDNNGDDKLIIKADLHTSSSVSPLPSSSSSTHQQVHVPKSDQKQQQQLQQQQQHIYRRVKNKAPLPPKCNSNNSIYQASIQQQPRSQSVDRILRSNANEFNKSSTPTLGNSISNNSNQNILAGRFVRVTVDPKQQYLNYFKNYKSYQNYQQQQQTNSGTRLTATVSTSNLYKTYHTSSNTNNNNNNNNKSSINNLQQHSSNNINSHEPSGGLLSLSNLGSSIMPMQYGYSTVKAPKNYLHAAQHFSSHHHHQPQSMQQSHFLASSWTQSMDPRKARK